jgi:hypothetical protein
MASRPNGESQPPTSFQPAGPASATPARLASPTAAAVGAEAQPGILKPFSKSYSIYAINVSTSRRQSVAQLMPFQRGFESFSFHGARAQAPPRDH